MKLRAHGLRRFGSFVGCITGFHFVFLSGLTSFALAGTPTKKPVLADIENLKKIGAQVLATHTETGVGYAQITPEQEQKLSKLNHDAGRCGGFEALPEEAMNLYSSTTADIFGHLSQREAINRRLSTFNNVQLREMRLNPEIADALKEVSIENLRQSVEMLSAFETRYHRGKQPNEAVHALKAAVEKITSSATYPVSVDLISHSSTPQKSLRVRIPGSERPSEIIVLGGHLDSVNQDWFGSKEAPGADDNASGSSNLVEALRILLKHKQPERTIEFMWYAGEEGGLLGSAEIARTYRTENKDVIAVIQLDMTLHPGDGIFTLGSMTDFTSAWLRQYLHEINSIYIKARIIEDRCGYGCSDHASWYRQNYPTLMPFEASFSKMNRDIHTARDTVVSTSSFEHSAMFSRIVLAIALDLGNSTLREPK